MIERPNGQVVHVLITGRPTEYCTVAFRTLIAYTVDLD